MATCDAAKRTILVYEFITGGGLLRLPDQSTPTGSLFEEGSAMISALVADLEELADLNVITMTDHRLADVRLGHDDHVVKTATEHDELLRQLASSADQTIVIAPELDGQLLSIYDLVLSAGGSIIGPRREVVRWASDKNLTAQKLCAAGVPTASQLDSFTPSSFPVVVKRVDGAGSKSVHRCDSARELKKHTEQFERDGVHYRVESYCDGTPVSVALLLGHKEGVTRLLPTCRQQLSSDGRFHYYGSQLLTDTTQGGIAARAQRLAKRVADQLLDDLGNTGYVGIDMVIDPSSDSPNSEWVIEINPRFTTSYIHLRAVTTENLAEAMLRSADQQY